ncbi:MAG: 3-phosphoshikimate 1-carboxyvinyltransferase, partial [Lentisphaerae bacterium]|nr:3-phosphoshikimate 1-carboxyvinyltransferase [Lentisphaerota bacterium]
ALADGESSISGFLRSDDCIRTLGALANLGAVVEDDGETIKIHGVSGRMTSPGCVIDMGNSGTGIRLISGLLAGQQITVELTGDESLRSRPMDRIKVPLEMMGAVVDLKGHGGCAPIRIKGGHLHGISYKLPVASAQIKSCILMAGLFADGITEVVEPRATRDHTEIAMRLMDINVSVVGKAIRIEGYGTHPPHLLARQWRVPGDFSSSAFWIAAAAGHEGSELTVKNVGLNPRRTAMLNILRRMGADIDIRLDEDVGDGGEPAGTITVRGHFLEGTEISGDEIPNVIDELPVIAAIGSVSNGKTIIRDASELRVKESDRIATMLEGLIALGVKAREMPDGLEIIGNAHIRGGCSVQSHGDHRIAMAMAILSTFADSAVAIEDVSCVGTSYPGFWDDMRRLTRL